MLRRVFKKNRMYNFNEKLISTLTEHNINESNFLGHSIGQLVIDELEKFYDFLSKEDSVTLAENQPSN